MKIGLITFSRARNYGGILQAYALNAYLRELGNEAFFIDYILERSNIYEPDVYVDNATKLSKVWCKNGVTKALWKWLYFDKIKADYLTFSDFIEKECSFSRKYFSIEELKNDPPQADLYVVGSDQVWNSDYAPQKALELPFYLPFVNGRKISYASSFGNDTIPEQHKKQVQEMLQPFSALSVREDSGKKILNELGLHADVVLDPTLLFTGAFWSRKTDCNLFKDEPYMLLYQVRFDANVYRTAKVFAQKLGCKMVIISANRTDRRKYDQDVLISPNVETWLSAIQNARLVYTDSFHATVFSLLFHTQLVVNSASRKNMASRITTLLKLAELENLEMKNFDIDEGLRKMGTKIDWAKVDELLQSHREYSQKWLQSAIETGKGGTKV